MRHFAIVGSGPGGFYTAEALNKAYGEHAQVDVLDRYPVPYGLVRFGVAPDHQSLKAVAKRYDKTADSAGVGFIGNVCVGRDVSVAELLEFYDAVVLAIGAPDDRKLGIPGEDLPGVIGSGAFVGWYNGHPEYRRSRPAAGGHPCGGHRQRQCRPRLCPNPVEDEGRAGERRYRQSRARSARLLADRTVTILGRRGPLQISMTPKELGELGRLEAATPLVDPADFPDPQADDALEPGQRKSVTLLREFASAGPDEAKPARIVFDFFAKPLAIEGDGRRNGSSSSEPGSTRTTARSAPARPMTCPPAW
jgi:hypothetical protein